MSVTTDMVEEFKDRMHISHSGEDNNLKRMLSFSISALQETCGRFDIEESQLAKELVFERTRYAYNDAVEYFEDNFLSQINGLGLSLAFKESEENAEV